MNSEAWLVGATMVHVQASAVPGGDHPALRSLVLQVWDIVSGFGRDDGGTRRRSGPIHDHALGSLLCSRAREAGATKVFADERPYTAAQARAVHPAAAAGDSAEARA